MLVLFRVLQPTNVDYEINSVPDTGLTESHLRHKFKKTEADNGGFPRVTEGQPQIARMWVLIDFQTLIGLRSLSLFV